MDSNFKPEFIPVPEEPAFTNAMKSYQKALLDHIMANLCIPAEIVGGNPVAKQISLAELHRAAGGDGVISTHVRFTGEGGFSEN